MRLPLLASADSEDKITRRRCARDYTAALSECNYFMAILRNFSGRRLAGQVRLRGGVPKLGRAPAAAGE